MAMKGLFTTQIISMAAILVPLPLLIYWSANKIIKLRFYSQKYYRYGVIGVSLIIMSFNGGIIGNIVETVKILKAEAASFEVALDALGMDNYIFSNDIEAQRGKNIIVISLESYEKGFLSDAKAHLTPNMRSLARRWNYYNMKQAQGSGWTSGSLYTSLTGLPAFFRGNGNLLFQKSYDSRIAGIGHVLNNAGYHMTYLVGNASFSGIEDLLNTFQITQVIDQRKFKEKYETNAAWGIHDKDLFEEARLEVRSRKDGNKPFALFISTIASHNPDGVYDSRMEGLVDPQETTIEFMVASVDYLVAEFIHFLETEDVLQNTVVYIFPDHLKLGDGSLFNNTGDRGLYLITNASDDDLSFDTSDIIYQIDLPRIILEGAAIESNAKFLTDYIHKDKEEFIRKNAASIATLNSSGLKRENVWTDELFVELGDFGNVVVRFDRNVISISSDTIEKFVARLSFSGEMRLIKTEFTSQEEHPVPNNNLSLNLHLQDGLLFAYLQKGARIPLLKTDKEKISFSLEDIKTISKLYESQKQGLFSWEGNSFMEIGSSTQQEYSQHLLDIPYNISEGIIEVDYATIGDAIPFVIIYGQPYYPSTVVLQDRIPNSSKKATIRFPFSKSVQAPALVFRNWSRKGKLFIYSYEIVGYGYDNGFRFTQKTEHFTEYATDKNRFIAHAGGSIGGKTYTNSLEALNSSYDKGFRLFELDIIKTSDGKYVAAHDWKHWSEITGYEGVLPAIEKEFLEHEIYGEFTPMNMTMINQWFEEHADAILVTDKINEPKLFAAEFVDKKRLMMELFSLDAVKEALAVGIKSSMPSESVLIRLGKDKVAALRSLGVKDISVSRKYIAPNITFLERLKDNDIKAYVFHINLDAGIDEKFVVHYEMDYIYGLYADKWDFR